MVTYTVLSIRPETKIKVKECIKEFLRHHPELDGMKISENMIVLRIAKYYLNENR